MYTNLVYLIWKYYVHFPSSIIIVLLNFQETLDADDTPLIDRHGKRMESDIVQFVPLRKFHSRSGANFSLVNKTNYRSTNETKSLTFFLLLFEG